jgi:hypothetical protein
VRVGQEWVLPERRLAVLQTLLAGMQAQVELHSEASRTPHRSAPPVGSLLRRRDSGELEPTHSFRRTACRWERTHHRKGRCRLRRPRCRHLTTATHLNEGFPVSCRPTN